MKWSQNARLLLKIFSRPTLLLLCLGGSIRNAGQTGFILGKTVVLQLYTDCCAKIQGDGSYRKCSIEGPTSNKGPFD